MKYKILGYIYIALIILATISLLYLQSVKNSVPENFVLPTRQPKSNLTAEVPIPTGTLNGHVDIGPICPVVQKNNPCKVSAATYAAHEFVVLDSSQKEVTRFIGGIDGDYSLNLKPGTYTIKSVKTGLGYTSKNLPATVLVKKDVTAVLNISIDTGIR